MEIIDLTVRKPGCTGHPIVRLNAVLRDMRKKRKSIKVIINTEDIPLRALELSLKRYKYKIKRVFERKDTTIVEIEAVLGEKCTDGTQNVN